ncbi:MAG TPA: discoidin domain-containing protein [Bacteroidales bacterium]|jgi:hypothetical protein|nr:discoidin domain-containing protein [Bacteroidales bacterium]
MKKPLTLLKQKKFIWRKFILLLALLPFLSVSVVAQVNINATTYTFSRNGFSPTALTSPVTLIGANSDNVASPVTDIGFTFWFAGTPYTQFSVSENGLMTLGSTQISGTDFANNLASATTMPKIAPYWDDLATGTNGSVVYQVSGTAPNRILYVNWNVTVPKNAGGTANSLIQVQLSEGPGTITFTYGTPAVPANTNMYSVGIGAATNDFASVTPTSAAAATCAYGVANNNITISPGVYTRYNFIPDRTAPTISAQTIPNTFGTGNRILTKTIADAKTGVPTTGSLVPRIYFKKSSDASYVSTEGVLTSGTGASGIWNFTVDHSIIPGGVAEGDVINYFVIAQDQSTTLGNPNIISNPTGVVATDVNTITTPPTPASYILGTSFSDTVRIGTGGNFASLSLSGGLFEAINAGQLTGNLIVKIISDLPSETGTVPLNAWTNAAGGPFTMKIIPEGIRTVAGSLRLVGVKGLTIDGLNDGINSLTMGSPAISFGASNNTFTRTTFAGFSFMDASGTFPVNCSNNTISYCTVNGMIYFGSWVSVTGLNNVIDHNIITNFGQYGIHIDRGYRNFTISNNDIYQTSAGNYSTGIYIYNEAGTTNIFNNKIHDLRSGTGLGVYTAGIYYRFGLATDVLNIYNNLIYLDATTVNTAAYQLFGLFLAGAGTSNVYYNSIYIGGTGITTGNSAGVYRIGGPVNFKNNAVFNARSGVAVSQYYKNYGLVAFNLTNFVSDNNLFFANGTSSVLFNIGGQPGYSAGADYPTLAAWQSISGKDANSLNADPLFTSADNLLPLAVSPLMGSAVPLGSITTDITGSGRNATFPTIGAYELVYMPPNLALNKPSSSSSGTNTSKANDPDGSNNSYWNAIGYPQWWKVDLGKVYDLSSVVIRNWVDGLRYYQYTISASLDDVTYTEIASKTNTDLATDEGDTYTINGVAARYLKVNMTRNSANQNVHISDFRVYGTVNTSLRKITSTAGPGGSISPSGQVWVTAMTNQTFNIAPNPGYQLTDVVVDGVSQGAVSSYTFNSVIAEHTISATFTALTNNIALGKPATNSSGQNASKANDADGTNNSYWNAIGYPQWWKVDLGDIYDLSSIVLRNWVDGIRYYQYTISASLDDITYTEIASKNNTNIATNAGDGYNLSGVAARYLKVNVTLNSANQNVHISDFRVYGTLNTSLHKITSTAGVGGSISPSGEVWVPNLGNKAFNITPDPGYQITNLNIDGVDLGPQSSYTFTVVTSDHTISATFNTVSVNIALGKPSTSSSGYNIFKANDGDGSNNSYWNAIGYPQWWKVDLGDVYDLSSVVIRNWVDGIRYYQYTISASMDDVSYTEIASKTNTNIAKDAGDNYSVGGVTARYLRVNVTLNSANQNVQISDFRVYGTLNSSLYKITSTAGSGGSISPSGEVWVSAMTNQTFNVTSNPGYQLSDLVVDGVSQGAVSSFTFNSVTADHTISATFAPLSNNIALNKPATISSGYNASRANDTDGTNNSYWNGIGYPQWWKVDLGDVYDLSSIVIRNWVDGIRYYQYTIFSSMDDVTYTEIAAKNNTNVATDAGDGYNVNGVTARYLKVNVTLNSANQNVHISDFRVYGTPVLNLMNAGTGTLKATFKDETDQKMLNLNVFPNPFTDHFTIRIDSPQDEMFNIEVISLTGSTVYLRTTVPANTDNLLSPELTKGMYLLKVSNKEKVMIQRIIKH